MRLIVKPDCVKVTVVCGTVFRDMYLKDLLGSFVRVGYCIPIPDFYLVVHGLKFTVEKERYNGLINQSNQTLGFFKGNQLIYLPLQYLKNQVQKIKSNGLKGRLTFEFPTASLQYRLEICVESSCKYNVNIMDYYLNFTSKWCVYMFHIFFTIKLMYSCILMTQIRV